MTRCLTAITARSKMPGKALDLDAIQALLSGEDRHKAENLKVNREGPLDVLLQSQNCQMCARNESPFSKRVTAMYTVEGTPLCALHAMYALSKICVQNGYKFSAASIVPEQKGQL